MSQTETLLLVVLGFSLAALLFLFIGRVLWSLALRIGARRMQRQVPSTVAELQSERDRLRAEYAKLSQKLGSRLETLRMQTAEHMAEVTRNRNRIDTLVIDLNARDATISARDQAIEEHKTRIAKLESEQAEAHEALAGLRGELAAGQQEISELQARLAASLADLAVAASQASENTAPAPADAPDADERLRRRIGDLTALSQQMAESRTAEQLADPLLQEKLAQAARETEDLQAELARLDAAWSSKLAELGKAVPAATAADPAVAPSRAVANVVSLANRIRSLQKDTAQ